MQQLATMESTSVHTMGNGALRLCCADGSQKTVRVVDLHRSVVLQEVISAGSSHGCWSVAAPEGALQAWLKALYTPDTQSLSFSELISAFMVRLCPVVSFVECAACTCSPIAQGLYMSYQWLFEASKASLGH